MHRSRLTSVLFDVPAGAFAAESSFWSGALGRRRAATQEDDDYLLFDGLISGLAVMVQRLGPGTPARLHVDIETDDVEAEVRRLEALGAVRVEAIETWWVMRDPAGLLFCVVRVQSPEEFAAHATTWDDPAA
jgi:Glyoxalase-like domain